MILGIIAIVCGIVLFVFSGYITNQVAIGRGEIRSGQAKVKAGQEKVNTAQENVNTANKVIDNTTQVKGLGGLITSPAQEKINSGQAQINAGQTKIKKGIQEANYYEKLATQLKFGGIVLMVIGAVLLLFAFKIFNFFGRK